MGPDRSILAALSGVSRIDKFDAETGEANPDECDVVGFVGAYDSDCKSLISKIDNKKFGIKALIEGLMQPYQDKELPTAYQNCKLKEKWDLFNTSERAMKKFNDTATDNINVDNYEVEKKKGIQLFKAVVDCVEALKKCLDTCRAARDRDRAKESNERRKQRTDSTKKYKPLMDGGFPTTVIPLIQSLLHTQDINIDEIAKLEASEKLLNKDDSLPGTFIRGKGIP